MEMSGDTEIYFYDFPVKKFHENSFIGEERKLCHLENSIFQLKNSSPFVKLWIS